MITITCCQDRKFAFSQKKGNNMLGYKIYFNGDKFVADNIATEVQTVPCDSTVSWMANKTYADNAVEKQYQKQQG